MHAAFLTAHGGNEVVRLGERPPPVRRRSEVLVRMKSATLNQVDLYMRNSGAGISHTLPQIMGIDGAGVVEDADDDERFLSKGQRVALYPAVVCGRCEFCARGQQMLCTSVAYLGEHRDGTFCEFVSLPSANVFPLADTIAFDKAAALGVAYLTAWRMVFTRAQIKPWETVLILGIGGGVSLAALQLVKMLGATAIVTSRHSVKLNAAARIGADHGIDSSSQDVVAQVMELTDGRGVDAAIENVGEAVWSQALRCLVRGGRIVTCGATSGDHPSADLRRLFIRQLQVLGSTLGTFEEFQNLLKSAASGKFEPVVDSSYRLNDVHSALDKLEAGEQFGKIALEIDRGTEKVSHA